MVELFVFAPGEEIDPKEFAEVMLRLPFPYHHALPVVLDQFGEAAGQVRFAVRCWALAAKGPAPAANPISVMCPLCAALPWDPCAEHVPTGPNTGTSHVSLTTHKERHEHALRKIVQ